MHPHSERDVVSTPDLNARGDVDYLFAEGN